MHHNRKQLDKNIITDILNFNNLKNYLENSNSMCYN